MMGTKLTRARKVTVALIAGASMLTVTACSEEITLAPGAVDPNDSCGRYQKSIVAARKQENELVVQNVVAGAVAGALIGAIVAGPDNRKGGAIAGAILGGAVAGGETAKKQQSQREADAKLLRDVNSKAGSANQLMSNAGKSANALRSCRLGQIRALEQSVRAGKTSTSSAKAQLSVLKRRASTDNKIISASFNGIGRRVDRFVNTAANANGVETAIVNRQKAARSAKARKVSAATPNVARVRTTQSRVVKSDAKQSMQVSRQLDAIDVLLG